MSFLLPLARQRAFLRTTISHCEALRDDLRGICAPSFSRQATAIAHRLSLIAEHLKKVSIAEESKNYKLGRLERARKRDDIARRMHLVARRLRQSHPSDCLPTAQFFADSLLELFFPHIKKTQTILVCTTQTYGWSCLDVWKFLEESTSISDLLSEEQQRIEPFTDIQHTLDLLDILEHQQKDFKDLIQEKSLLPGYHTGADLIEQPPPRCAILGLAQLDVSDPLMFPLLAHELGHLEEFHRDQAWTRDLLRDRSESKEIQKFASFCIQELLCDLIATRMLGISYLCALHHFFSITEGNFENTSTILSARSIHTEDFYPTSSFRLRCILDQIRLEHKTQGTIFQNLVDELEKIVPRMDTFFKQSIDSNIRAVETVVRDILPRMKDIASRIIPEAKLAKLPDHLPRLMQELKDGIPPLNIGVERAAARNINEVICAGWALRLSGASDANTNALVDKSIELNDLLKPGSDLEQEDLSTWGGLPIPSQSGVLSSNTLRSHLARTVGHASTAPEQGPLHQEEATRGLTDTPNRSRVLITPIISKKPTLSSKPESPIQAASYELHLGNWFKVAHRTRHPFVSLAEKEARLLALREWHSEYYVRKNEDFILHPQDFALACSIEFIALPNNVMALVDGKSGLGRMGLSIATAAQVAPGFRGSLVLELFNVGTIPLKLRPGMAVAQLVFLTTDQPVPDDNLYQGSFRYQLRPLDETRSIDFR